MYIKFILNNILFNVLYHIRVHVYMSLLLGVRGIHFASVYDFSVGFWYCSDSVFFFFFFLIHLVVLRSLFFLLSIKAYWC